MKSWQMVMHIVSEHEIKPTLTDPLGNSITYNENGTYTLVVNGQTYPHLNQQEVTPILSNCNLKSYRFL